MSGLVLRCESPELGLGIAFEVDCIGRVPDLSSSRTEVEILGYENGSGEVLEVPRIGYHPVFRVQSVGKSETGTQTYRSQLKIVGIKRN